MKGLQKNARARAVKKRSLSFNEASTGLRTKQKKKRIVLKKKYSRLALYRKVKALLRSKGIRVTVYRLKRTPDRTIVNYIRKRFTPEEVARFMPVRYIFPQVSRVKQNSRKSKRTKNSPQAEDWYIEANLATQEAEQLHPVMDIDSPMPLIEEISAPDNFKWNRGIFDTNDNSSFDPGLWLTLQSQLPKQYRIPDKQFTEALEIARKKYGARLPLSASAHTGATSLASQTQEVSSDSPEANIQQEMMRVMDEIEDYQVNPGWGETESAAPLTQNEPIQSDLQSDAWQSDQ